MVKRMESGVVEESEEKTEKERRENGRPVSPYAFEFRLQIVRFHLADILYNNFVWANHSKLLELKSYQCSL